MSRAVQALGADSGRAGGERRGLDHRSATLPSTAPVHQQATRPSRRFPGSPRAGQPTRSARGTSFASARESALRPWLKVQVAAAAELADGGLDVLGAHQRLADQHRVDPDALEIVELLARAEARLATTVLPAGTSESSSYVRSMSTLKSDRSRLLRPSTSASTSKRHLELVLVVDLDDHVEVERPRLAEQLGEEVDVERGDDQQDRVRAGGRGLVDLVRGRR
jgi:hypothetical protein